MNDSDGSHSCQQITEEMTPQDPDDPGPKRPRHATCDVSCRYRLRA